MLTISHNLLTGSILSELKAKWKSTPDVKPEVSKIGATTLSTVPGYDVDSRMTNDPVVRYLDIKFDASSIKLTLGFPSLRGVGTVITATSKFIQSCSSLLGVNSPVFRAALICPFDISSIYDCPDLNDETLFSSMSKPTTF